MQLGFIGTGEITSAIVTGLSSSGTTHPIWLSPRNAVIANGLAKRFPGISVASSNQEVLDRSDTVVIGVRPSVAQPVLAELGFRPDHQVISLVSGLSLASLAELVAPATGNARAVPLPSAAQRLSPTAIYPAHPAACELFAAVGSAFPVESEYEFDAICAATATIATYFAFNETIASWLERQGLSASQARDYVARLFLGVTTGAVDESERSFQLLSTAHATAGGINEQFLKYMVDHGLLLGISQGLGEILQRIRAHSSPKTG